MHLFNSVVCIDIVEIWKKYFRIVYLNKWPGIFEKTVYYRCYILVYVYVYMNTEANISLVD